VPVERCLEEALSLAAEIAVRAPLAVRLGKEAVNHAFEAFLSEGWPTSVALFTSSSPARPERRHGSLFRKAQAGMEREVTSFRELVESFAQPGRRTRRPVIVHASLSAFGKVRGGAETLLGALLASFGRVMMPAFTYKTMIVPEVGPPNNALMYGGGGEPNRMAEFYHPDMPVDRLIGAVAEALRRSPLARRSSTRSYPSPASAWTTL